MSRLKNLSPIDFEELCRDIALLHTGVRFSAFGPGPDAGIDGRHSKGNRAVILQCKHYQGSFSSLIAAAKKEVGKVQKLRPRRYLFYTSQSLTPKKKERLEDIFKGLPIDPDDICGLEDIEDTLRRNPKLEKAHFKLWLTSSSVLERILQSGLEAFTQATKDEIVEELQVYVRNQSFEEALEKLESERVLIISGPPGVGKTTLAKIVAYNYLSEDWNFCAINSLEDGFTKIIDNEPTIFFFDDFLGRIELDRQALIQKDTALSMFVRQVKKSKNARFILTTRAHIFEDARRISDHIDDRRLQLAKYLLDVGIYTRRVKSHILFNHLMASGFSKNHFMSLLEGNFLSKVIDHKNYNPRVISSVSSACIDDIEPDKYGKYILSALEDPELIWDKPFRSLDARRQNLLITLFFGSQYTQSIERLRLQYRSTHRAVCLFYSQSINPNDFEESLRALESGFISIHGNSITFVNPSLRDYLKSYLTNEELLKILAESATQCDWAKHLWNHLLNLFFENKEKLSDISLCFKSVAKKATEIKTYEREARDGFWSFMRNDLSIAERIELILQWWEYSHDEYFLRVIHGLLTSRLLDIVTYRDGPLLPELHRKFSDIFDDKQPLGSVCLSHIERLLVKILEERVPLDELVTIIESANEFLIKDEVTHVFNAIVDAVVIELSETEKVIGELDSEGELGEYKDYLIAAARLTDQDPAAAIVIVNNRIDDLQERGEPCFDSPFNHARSQSEEKFTDDDVKSLFSELLK